MDPEKKQQIILSFAEELQSIYGDELVSVIHYGMNDGLPNKPPGTLVILRDNTPSELALFAPELPKWRKKGLALPLFLTKDYIKSSLDTFPLEFMDIAGDYEVIYGEDVFEGISFVWTDVRAQCERELKGKLLYLREEYLALYNDSKGLSDLIQRSLEGFRTAFEGSLFLKNIPLPESSDELLDDVIAAYGLDEGIFLRLKSIAEKKEKISGKEAAVIFDKYIEELDKLCYSIDSLTMEEA